MAQWVSRRGLLLGGAAFVACRGASRVPGPAVDLWFGGDVHLGRDRPRLDALAGFVRGARGIVNLEGPVGAPPHADIHGRDVRLSNEGSLLPALAASGVEVVTIANNHMADDGPEGERWTRVALAQAGLEVAGRGAGVATRTEDGRRLAHCAFEVGELGYSELLRRAALGADYLTVSFHVTGPPSYLPGPELRAAVDEAAARGARVVVAHGTHALGPVERRGNCVIAWGLGNLLFSCVCTKELEGAVLRVRLDGERTEARVLPIDAGLMGEPARPAREPALLLDVLEAIGSSPLERGAVDAAF